MLDWKVILLGEIKLWSLLGFTLALFPIRVGFPNQVNTSCHLFLNNIGKLLLALLFIIIAFF